jgi:multicomponent Na+:H+ antiporter subunit C
VAEAVISDSMLFGVAAAMLIGLGLFGVVINPAPLRKILAFNLIGAGVFLLFGVVGRRGAVAGLGSDPVPQALVITGLVVAFAATAIAVMLVVRLYQTTGAATLAEENAGGGSSGASRSGQAPDPAGRDS